MSYRHKHIKPKIRNLKTKKVLFRRPVFWFFLALTTIIVILYFSLFYFKFQINNIEILGNQKNKSEDIQNIALEYIHKKIVSIGVFQVWTKSIFITNTGELSKKILSKFPVIESVSLQKKFPDSLFINIKERLPFAVFCNNENPEKCFFIDVNGIIFEELQNIPKDMIVLHKDYDGKNNINKNTMDVISQVEKNLKDNFQIDIKKVLISDPLVFTTSENWQIYFDPTLDINLQITKMDTLLKNEIPINNRKKLQYIYLQYKDRAYYK